MLAAAQSPTPNRNARPKIGLALAGGAALGLAHVGVIEWLEEHHVPIDYIAGTSMGGLVGGLYATGRDSAEIRKFVAGVDWNFALSSAPPFRALAFRRKEDVIDYPTAIEIGLKNHKVGLPSGLSPGHGVGLVISRFAAPYGDMKSFNDLPTPFRCVATDLTEASAVVFDHGSLFQALRATMSLPALFAPVELDNRLLVDGGLVNNLPVDVVKTMGADLIIASALDVPPDPTKYKSLLGVVGRSISLMVSQNERRVLGMADLVVMPDLKGLDAAAFQKYEEFRKVGYAAAEQKRTLLLKLAVNESEWQAYLAARKAKRRPDAIRADTVEVAGDIAPRRKESLLRAVQSGGNIVDRGVLENELTKLTGMGRYDTASYELFKAPGGEEGLRIRVHEKTHGPPFFRPSILIDGYNGGGIRFGIGGRFTALDFGGPASELRADVSVGAVNRLAGEYYYRLRGGKWFFAPRGEFTRFDFPLYGGDNRIAEVGQREWNAAADFGYAFGRFQEARIGYSIGHLRTAQSTGNNVAAPLEGRTAFVQGRWRYNAQDAPNLPRHGLRAELRALWYSDYPEVGRQFPAFEVGTSYAHPLSARWSALLIGAGGTTVDEFSLYPYFTQGGLYQLSALERRQLIGNNYYRGSAWLLRSLSGESISLFGRFYGAVGYEAGRAWYPALSASPRQDGVIGLVGETLFGVVFVGASVGDQGSAKVLFRVGRVF